MWEIVPSATGILKKGIQLQQLCSCGDVARIKLEHARVSLRRFSSATAPVKRFGQAVQRTRRLRKLTDIQLEDTNRVGVSAFIEKRVPEAIQFRLGKVVTCDGCRPELFVQREGSIDAFLIDRVEKPASNRELWWVVRAAMQDVYDRVGNLD